MNELFGITEQLAKELLLKGGSYKYGTCQNLEMARTAADAARRQGLVGMFPAAVVVLDMAYATLLAQLAASHSQGIREGPKSWRCFHCDAIFTDEAEALLHFGSREYHDAACTVSPEKVRDLKRQLLSYREEDTDLHRQIASLESKHHTALQREEEIGYAKGLSDGIREGLEMAAKKCTEDHATLSGPKRVWGRFFAGAIRSMLNERGTKP
jgi:hypothetical protein